MQKHTRFYVIIGVQLFIIIVLLYSVALKTTSQSIEVVPLDKNTLQITPLDKVKYFYEPKANITITEKYFRLVGLSKAPQYTINKDALNERFDYPLTKPKDTFRIITLGDSFTYGMYMDTKNNWPEVLEDSLQKCNTTHFEVINLAVPNYDLQYSVERYKLRGEKYIPDLVIWFVKDDDFAQLNEITSPLKLEYYNEMIQNGQLKDSVKKGEYWPQTTKAVEQFKEKYSYEQILSIQTKNLESLDNYYSGKLVMLTTKYTSAQVKSIIQEFTAKRGNSFAYTNPPDFSILPDHHPNLQGHKEIADSIQKYLIEKKVISCNK